MTEVTAENFEQLLDEGLLYAAMISGHWWLMRRNGKTKTLKRRPGYKEIPFKVGFRGTGRISTDTLNPNDYRHKDDVFQK
jgi:hypothetical protein